MYFQESIHRLGAHVREPESGRFLHSENTFVIPQEFFQIIGKTSSESIN